MKWHGYGLNAIKREDGKYAICRSPADGFVRDDGICYMLSSNGSVVGVERNVADNDEAKVAAIRRLKALCNE